MRYLNMRTCGLQGWSAGRCSEMLNQTYTKLTRPCAGAIPASIGNLTNLQKLILNNNKLSGACVEPGLHKNS